MIDDLDKMIAPESRLLLLAAMVLATGFLSARLAFRYRPIGRFLCQLIAMAAFTGLLIKAGVMPAEPTPAMGWTVTFIAISVLKIIWWFATASLLSGFFRAVLIYKRQPVENRLLQDLVAGFIYISAGLAIVANVFDIAVTGVLAASGVVAIIVGLALQSTLGDVFSGIVLNLAKPYHPGDWIILDGSLQGRVVETNWRATHILNDGNDLVIVPNSVIAKAKIVNASHSSTIHGVKITIRLDPAVVPARCCGVLETALLNCNQILHSPAPSVSVTKLDAVALECDIQFYVTTIDKASSARNEVFDLLFRHCAAANIRLAPPAGSPFALPPADHHGGLHNVPRRLLTHLPIFASLSDEERTSLEPKMRRRAFKAGDTLIESGEVARSLFILSSGVLVALRGPNQEEATRLAPGDCFGQGGLLTGAAAKFRIEALTKAVVYEIAKDDLAPILQERPAIAAELGQIMARREADELARLEELTLPADKHGENLAARLAERVKDLFGL